MQDLPAELDEVLPTNIQASYALFSLAIVIGLMINRPIPKVQAALISCLLMGLFHRIYLNSACRTIHLKSLILVVSIWQRTG